MHDRVKFNNKIFIHFAYFRFTFLSMLLIFHGPYVGGVGNMRDCQVVGRLEFDRKYIKH